MRIIVATKVRVHVNAQVRYEAWYSANSDRRGELFGELERTQGLPFGAKRTGGDKFLWSLDNTFVSYVIVDSPLAAFVQLPILPLLYARRIIIVDIFSI